MTSAYNLKQMHQLRKRISSIFQRFSDVLNSIQCSENQKEIDLSVGFINAEMDMLKNSLPSDLHFIKIFANDIYKPYSKCVYLQKIGYNIISKNLADIDKIDMIDDFIFKTTSIARDEKNYKHSVLLDATNLLKEEDNNNEAVSVFYSKTDEKDISFTKKFKRIIMWLHDNLRLKQPSDEDAATFMNNHFKTYFDKIYVMIRKVPDKTFPNIIKNYDKMKFMFGYSSSNFKGKNSMNNDKLEIKDSTKIIRKKVQDVHRIIKKNLPRSSFIAGVIQKLRSLLSSLSIAIDNEVIDQKINEIQDLIFNDDVKHKLEDFVQFVREESQRENAFYNNKSKDRNILIDIFRYIIPSMTTK